MKTTPGQTHDMNGYPIHPGDLLRSYHFTERRYRRRNYLYHVAVWNDSQGTMEMVPACHLEPAKRGGGGRCWLSPDMAATVEIISGHGPGDYLDFRDRPRVKREVVS